MTTRRIVLATLGAGALACAVPGFAQQAARRRRVGFLYFGSRESAVRTGRYDAFLDGMRALGYAVGKDFDVDERFTGGKVELLRDYATDLVRLKVDVIVVVGTPAVHEAKRATGAIPIVVAQMGGDPIRSGLGKSLARPGGNITGAYVSNVELLPKHLELLAAVAPKMTGVAVLSNPNNANHPGLLQTARAAAQKSRLQVIPVEARAPEDIEAAFSAMVRERANGLLILGDAFFVQQARQLADLALKHRLPLVSTTREYADAGGLMSYGEDSKENFRLAADYVDKIFKGANPGELPFRRSQRPQLVLNGRTFKALGLSIPHELALRADEVIQ